MFRLKLQHGGVHVGDVLCSCNDISLINMPFDDVKRILNDSNTLHKILKFYSASEHYSKKYNI